MQLGQRPLPIRVFLRTVTRKARSALLSSRQLVALATRVSTFVRPACCTLRSTAAIIAGWMSTATRQPPGSVRCAAETVKAPGPGPSSSTRLPRRSANPIQQRAHLPAAVGVVDQPGDGVGTGAALVELAHQAKDDQPEKGDAAGQGQGDSSLSCARSIQMSCCTPPCPVVKTMVSRQGRGPSGQWLTRPAPAKR